MTGTRNRLGVGNDCSRCAETPAWRGIRGSMELKLIAFIVLLSVAGFVWVQMRHGTQKEQARLFRYKDDKGQTVYTDTLEKVPVSQRQAALNDKSIKEITTADYDTYLDSVSAGGKEEQKGFFDSLKQALTAKSSETKEPGSSVGGVAKKTTLEVRSGKDKEAQDPPTDLKGIADVPKVVNESFSAISKGLGGN